MQNIYVTKAMLAVSLGLAVPATMIGLTSPAQAGMAQAEKITGAPVVEGTGSTYAVIAWTTNTGGSTVVKYGTDASHLDRTAQSPYSDNEKTQSQNHRVKIANLKPGTTYYFKVVSGQGEGTGSEAMSSVQQFTTKGQADTRSGGSSMGAQGNHAEKITHGPVVEKAAGNYAIVAWSTNTGGSSIVRYGTEKGSLTQTAESPYAKDSDANGETHRVTLRNLQPGTTYYYQVDTGQGQGTGSEARGSVESFKTTTGK